MLGATRTGALVHPVSVPPQEGELSATGKRDWKTGVELVKTCMDTHDTATYVLCVVYHYNPLFLTDALIFLKRIVAGNCALQNS